MYDLASLQQASEVYNIDRNKRAGIDFFDKSKKDLPILELCGITYEYNTHMGGSDENA